MKLLIFIALSINLYACGKGPNQIDPAFQALYDQFIVDANANGVHIDGDQGMVIKFGDLVDDDAGVCSGAGYGNGIITVDTGYWPTMDSNGKETLLYHELGHCVLNEKHSDNPKDIMYMYTHDGITPGALVRFFAAYGNATQ